MGSGRARGSEPHVACCFRFITFEQLFSRPESIQHAFQHSSSTARLGTIGAQSTKPKGNLGQVFIEEALKIFGSFLFFLGEELFVKGGGKPLRLKFDES